MITGLTAVIVYKAIDFEYKKTNNQDKIDNNKQNDKGTNRQEQIPPFKKDEIVIPINRFKIDKDKKRQWSDMQIKDYMNLFGTNIIQFRDRSIDKIENKLNQSQSIIQFREQFHKLKHLYIKPIQNIMNSLPAQITQIKFGIINSYNYTERMIATTGLSTLLALRQFSKSNNLFSSRQILYITRRTSIGYLGIAWILCPQIYNPLIVSD